MSGFGTAKRPSMATKSGVPGPGAYKLKNTVGEACILFPHAAAMHPGSRLGNASQSSASLQSRSGHQM